MGCAKIMIDWKFKRAVKDRGFTLQMLQEITGINQALLSMYGNGKYNLDQIERRKISMALKMPESEIFSN
jgi:hypothetical protein